MDQLIDVWRGDTLQVRLERYNDAFSHTKTMNHTDVEEGDVVVTAPLLGGGDEFIVPEEFQDLKEAFREVNSSEKGSSNPCRLCNEPGEPTVYVLESVVHVDCLEEFVEGAEALLQRNPDIATSTAI